MPAEFLQWCHGYVVTSHKAQGWTADHVIVAAERFTAKGAYVACSRGRQSCIIHTPDKARLMERLPEGNRRAGLDVLSEMRDSYSQACFGVETTRGRIGAVHRWRTRSTGGLRACGLRTRETARARVSKLKNRRLPREIQGARNVIVFRSADLDRPFITYNAELLAILGLQLERELAALTVAARAKWILLRLLGGHRPELGEVAKDLGMSIRTLQRRITNEGTEFRLLVSDARREPRQALPAGPVAWAGRDRCLLDYEDPNSFFRAFREWRALLQASGEPLPRPICVNSQAGLHARYELLTLREREVMRLVVKGLLNKQVARELATSEIIVKIQRGQIMRKMEASSLAGFV